MTSVRRALGDHGETLVANWYEDHGYTVVARNWRCRNGEIDIVAAKGSVVVICEVKTRSSNRFGLPVEAITFTKQRRLRRLAAMFLAANPQRANEIRFDVGSVQGNSVELLEGVV